MENRQENSFNEFNNFHPSFLGWLTLSSVLMMYSLMFGYFISGLLFPYPLSGLSFWQVIILRILLIIPLSMIIIPMLIYFPTFKAIDFSRKSLYNSFLHFLLFIFSLPILGLIMVVYYYIFNWIFSYNQDHTSHC